MCLIGRKTILSFWSMADQNERKNGSGAREIVAALLELFKRAAPCVDFAMLQWRN